MDELAYWLELLHTPSIGQRRYQSLLTCINHPRELFDGSQGALLQKLPERARSYLKKPDWQRTEKALNWAEHPNHHIIPITSSNYPHRLKQIADPPPLLFAMGELNALHDPQLAIVGSRNPSPQGKQNANDFSAALSQSGLTITSGLALGVDTQAHIGALASQGLTIAVMGTGLDVVYPSSNRHLAQQIVEQGVVLSEFPLATMPNRGNFPRRNRIISGLSLGVLVVEAGLASGSLISARLAAEQGREVFAIPGSIHNALSRGCHQLLREGAKLVESTQDILQEFSGPLLEYLQPVLNEQSRHSSMELADELKLLLKNIGADPISIDQLITRCGLTAEQISSMLMQLELQKLVASSAGHYYRLPE